MMEFLAIDHIGGGGTKHRKSFGRGSSLYRWLEKSGLPGGFRVLCHNCNMAIGFYGYCPHKTKTNWMDTALRHIPRNTSAIAEGQRKHWASLTTQQKRAKVDNMESRRWKKD
jgi:hypothetical protein